ncbi:HU family DNA-binding protein [Moheibacter sp.]|uniref:HU family DNA-binding protein n=1 Tax=Moheibacter sp. TaxID=1965316 RepID=UPI003C78E034
MNKSELIDAMAADAGISKAAAKKALDSFTSNVTKSLKKGDKVSLVGFGTFSTSKRSARNGINPQTKKTIKIAAKTVAKFKAGSELSAAVDGKKK